MHVSEGWLPHFSIRKGSLCGGFGRQCPLFIIIASHSCGLDSDALSSSLVLNRFHETVLHADSKSEWFI